MTLSAFIDMCFLTLHAPWVPLPNLQRYARVEQTVV
jgi:hypothetical protein